MCTFVLCSGFAQDFDDEEAIPNMGVVTIKAKIAHKTQPFNVLGSFNEFVAIQSKKVIILLINAI